MIIALSVGGGCKRADPPYAMAGINPRVRAECERAGPSDDEVRCRRDAAVQGTFVNKKRRYEVILTAYQDCLVQRGGPR